MSVVSIDDWKRRQKEAKHSILGRALRGTANQIISAAEIMKARGSFFLAARLLELANCVIEVSKEIDKELSC
jgi:hypothetical protein